MTACCLALQCTFKWLHLKNDLSLRRSAKYCVFLQDKNGSQFRWNRKVEVRNCLPGTFRVVPSFKFVLSKMTASKIISEESLCLTKKKTKKKHQNARDGQFTFTFQSILHVHLYCSFAS